MSASLEFETERGVNRYSQRLFHAAGDSLVFADESVTFQAFDHPGPGHTVPFGVGHVETKLKEAADAGDQTAKAVRHLLNQCRGYQFHDTSATAPSRGYCYRGNDRWLAPHAGNVAAMLYRFRELDTSAAYRRIVGTVRQVAPFLGDFELEPTGRDLILNWRDKSSSNVFGPHQLSDGTLRFISLATLLLQPDELLPDVVVIDEPELGLHPAALNLLAGMLQTASHSSQVIVATQSAALLDSFAAEDIVVVDRRDNASEFHRLNEDDLRDWLKDYSLGQLWEKNVIGGGPFE
jgi:predicted ATPase